METLAIWTDVYRKIIEYVCKNHHSSNMCEHRSHKWWNVQCLYLPPQGPLLPTSWTSGVADLSGDDEGLLEIPTATYQPLTLGALMSTTVDILSFYKHLYNNIVKSKIWYTDLCWDVNLTNQMNFRSLEVVCRGSETQLQVIEKLNWISQYSRG